MYDCAILLDMFSQKISVYLLILFTSLGLIACDRNDYVTWHCKIDLNQTDEKPLTMILEGSSMKLQDKTYHYCGSLGTISYFDLNCSGSAAQSAISFIPKTGILKRSDQVLHCISL